jgi:hypothetical protein
MPLSISDCLQRERDIPEGFYLFSQEKNVSRRLVCSQQEQRDTLEDFEWDFHFYFRIGCAALRVFCSKTKVQYF